MIIMLRKKQYIPPKIIVIPLDEDVQLLNDSPAITHTVATAARGWAKEAAWLSWDESEEEEGATEW